jgi:predicted alpha/beta-hydrolase family hydrolase
MTANQSRSVSDRGSRCDDSAMEQIEIETPRGPARAELRLVDAPRAALVMGHGAGGGITAPDLVRTARAATARAVSVALVEQPYRVAGRRAPAPAAHLDEAWLAVIGTLGAGPFAGLPLLQGGRSMGARVACRTAAAAGAIGVICLAFPVHPPGRADDPGKSRLPELDAVSVPTLVVQGERDAFGMPPPGRSRTVSVVAGDHSLRQDLGAVERAVSGWLEQRLPPP